MEQIKTTEEVLPPNWINNGIVYLLKCPKCKQENYAIAVSSGTCAWCAFTYYEKIDENGRHN